MFNNDLFSDVKFVVPKTHYGRSESKQVIPAHKFVLSISSPVFEAMFNGELAETRDSIELPDCEYESLLELFRYMYSDEVNLSGSNVMRVLYLAKKYMVPSLAEECTEYLHNNLDPSNVFSILPSAQKYEEKNLVDRCWEIVDKQTEEAVKSDEFATIERSLLEVVVIRDTLIIEEIELFKAVDLWATKECERQGLAAEGEVKRRILGEEVIKGIRFPTMKQEDFASVVLDSDILTKGEIVSIIKHLNSVVSSPVGFQESKRSGYGGDIQRFCRYGSLSSSYFRYRASGCEAINFSVDKDIVLLGVCLFGSENNTYSVTLEVKDTTSGTVLVSKTAEFPSKLIQGENCSYYGFEVLFEKKIILRKNVSYHMGAILRGPKSLYGVDCLNPVMCGVVTFTFIKNTMYFYNGTDVQHGQFPELLFAFK